MAVIVSAADVRAYFERNPQNLPEGVVIGSRGRIHPKAVEVFNKKSKGKKKYTVGVNPEPMVKVTTPEGEKVLIPNATLRKFAKGKRGRYSAETVEAALKSLADA